MSRCIQCHVEVLEDESAFCSLDCETYWVNAAVELVDTLALAEAIEAIKILDRDSESPSLFSGDAALRRVALKNAALRMPCRPFVKFIYLYFWRRGWLPR
jgi:hypothetical protein